MEPAISFKNLRKVYKGGVEALRGVDLDIREGEFFGLLGLNGAGKTTSINVIAGLVKPTSGRVVVHGFDAVRQYRQTHAHIGIAPQEEALDSIFFNVKQILVYQAGYFGVPRREATKRADALLKEFNLWEKRKAKVVELSGGMKRRLILAKALIPDPPILILDEPTAGADVALRRQIWEKISGLNRAGKTILLTTHYLEEAEQLCERIAIIHHGEVVATGSPKELISSLIPNKVQIRTEPPLSEVPRGFEQLNPAIEENCLYLDGTLGEPKVMRALVEIVERGHQILSVEQQQAKLEDVFLQITEQAVSVER